MKNRRFPVVIEQDADGFIATCPTLQGCYSQGATYEEVIKNIKDAIKLHVEDRQNEDEDLPGEATLAFSSVEVAV
jgi:predicted RNase H-like HicB family nuclease